ncbi:hypothetical protein [Pedobacter immunditicola]|uniref:hypothetical protein n=1 Tax=Pedobacter immunditicola TaxID=3133440 RepID=UPI0030B45DEB
MSILQPVVRDKPTTTACNLRKAIKASASAATVMASLFTIRPSPYPNGDIPAHIHALIKEPDLETSITLTNLCLTMIPY